MNKRKPLSASVALFLCLIFPCAAWAATDNDGPNWVEEYEFVSATEDFHYSQYPKTIQDSGRTYTVTGEIKYEKVEEIPLYETAQEEIIREIRKTGMAEQNDDAFAQSITVQDDGQEAILQRQSVQWAERTEEGAVSIKNRTVDYGIHTETPEAASTLEVTIGGEKREMELKEVRQITEWAWEMGHIADITLMDGDDIPLDSEAPEWSGKEAQVLALLHLDPLHYILRGSRWAQSDNGGDVRRAQFILDRYVARFAAIYQCEIKGEDRTLYDGTALYSGMIDREVQTGVEYKAKAYVTYQAPPDPVTLSPSPKPTPTIAPTEAPKPIEEKKSSPVPVVAGVGGGLAVTGGAVWYFFVFRKRQQGGAVK